MGQQVRQQKINAPSTVILRNGLAAGIYFYRLCGDGFVSQGKFVIE
jgi:hypothetical protein